MMKEMAKLAFPRKYSARKSKVLSGKKVALSVSRPPAVVMQVLSANMDLLRSQNSRRRSVWPDCLDAPLAKQYKSHWQSRCPSLHKKRNLPIRFSASTSIRVRSIARANSCCNPWAKKIRHPGYSQRQLPATETTDDRSPQPVMVAVLLPKCAPSGSYARSDCLR